ncbi:MAG: CpsD/CapB family tyrosine-protein kinase [bacterium]|nr:CpsD/CapB family tyrosine-protein kinase [bacterium]
MANAEFNDLPKDGAEGRSDSLGNDEWAEEGQGSSMDEHRNGPGTAAEANGVHRNLPDRGRSLSEREVLRVLWNNLDTNLVRGQIHKRLNPIHRLTPGRIGQILAALHGDGLLVRVLGRAQGSRSAGYYRLSDLGRELCRCLGFDREDLTLFPATEELLARYLTAEHLASQSDEPGRIIAFHSPRRGLGQSTMAASAACLLANHLKDRQCRALVVDFDLDEPGLDTFFAPQGLGDCRGLRGLVIDFHKLPERRRRTWLREALTNPRYVFPAVPEIPNLSYFPSGFAPDPTVPVNERSEARARLWDEATLLADQQVAARGTPTPAGGSFLRELRNALFGTFDKILLDTQAGLSLGAWAATHMPADDLIICLRFNDERVEGLRAVLANFFRQQEDRGHIPPRVAFAFAPSKSPIAEEHLQVWIDQNLLKIAEVERIADRRYRTLALRFNYRLVEGVVSVKDLRKIYRPLLTFLTKLTEFETEESEESDQIPMSFRLVLEELVPKLKERDKLDRDVLKGALASALAEKQLVPELKSGSLSEELGEDVIDLANRTEDTMRMPEVKTYR